MRTRDKPNHTPFGAYQAAEPPHSREWRTRRRCWPWFGHLATVERALTTGVDAQSQGGANATNDARNGREGRETRADRGVARAPSRSGELYRTRETHRAWLSASTGAVGRGGAVGGRGEEGGGQSLPGEELRASVAMARGGAAAARAGERARVRVERHKCQRGRRRTRPGAPGGRPGRVQAAACSPRGGRALSARHGGTARPSARGHGAGVGKGASAGGLGQLRPAG